MNVITYVSLTILSLVQVLGICYLSVISNSIFSCFSDEKQEFGPNKDQLFLLGSAKQGHNILTKEKKENGDTIVYDTFKAFSPNDDEYYIEKAIELLSNIIEIRKSYYNKSQFDRVNFFQDISKLKYEDTLISMSTQITSTNILFNEAKQHYNNKEYDKAIYTLNLILQLDDSNIDALYLLGNCYCVKKD